MNLTTILSAIFESGNNDMQDFDQPVKPEYFFIGETVINEETGELGYIENIIKYPYAVDGTFDHDIYCAYVIGWNSEMKSICSDYWLYDDISPLQDGDYE